MLSALSRVSAEDSPPFPARSPRLTPTEELVTSLRRRSTRSATSSPSLPVSRLIRFRQIWSANCICELDYGIPKWFLNRQRCIKDGTWSQTYSNMVDTKLREDLERMKRARKHRGLRHFWNLKVKGQRTKSTGRTGKTLGVTRKK